MPTWTSVNPVGVGKATKAEHYDKAFDNTLVLKTCFDDSGDLSFPAATELTIASDAITVTQNTHRIDTEGDAATDNLSTITAGANVRDEHVLILTAENTARVATLQDGVGNLRLNGDYALSDVRRFIGLIKKGTLWIELFRTATGAHAIRQSFRHLQVLSPNVDSGAAHKKVRLDHADEIVLDDGTRVTDWDDLICDLDVAGAGGLDTGTVAADTWYRLWAIRKSSDGTRNVLAQKAPWYDLNQTFTTDDTSEILRNGATDRVKLAQGFKVANVAPIPFAVIRLDKVGTPSGDIWLTIETDSSGNPSGTVQATSHKVRANNIPDNAANTVKSYVLFWFPAPFTPADTTTQYHLVLQGDYAVSSTNHLRWRGGAAGGYANGAAKKYDGTNWAAAAPADFVFKIGLLRDTLSPTMPSGYDQKAVISYLRTNTTPAIKPYVQKDRLVQWLESTLNIGAGFDNLNNPDLDHIGYPLGGGNDPAVWIPPITPVTLDLTLGIGAAADQVTFVATALSVGPNFSGSTPQGPYVQQGGNAGTAASFGGRVVTGFQACYARRSTSGGQVFVLGFEF